MKIQSDTSKSAENTSLAVLKNFFKDFLHRDPSADEFQNLISSSLSVDASLVQLQ